MLHATGVAGGRNRKGRYIGAVPILVITARAAGTNVALVTAVTGQYVVVAIAKQEIARVRR